MLKTIIFDLDDTLYPWKPNHAPAFAQVEAYARNVLGVPEGELGPHYQSGLSRVRGLVGEQAAIHNREIRFLRFLEERGLPLHHARVMERIYWDSLIAAASPMPGCVACLRELKEAGYTLGIGSNMTLNWQLVKLERLGLLPYFSFVVTSEEAGCEKPDPGLFRLCMEKAGSAPQECVFIGDNFQGDVLGAEAVGMKALWFAPGERSFREHPGFSRFDELPAILAGMETTIRNS